MKLDRILVGVDGSAASTRAVEWAAAVARMAGAEVVAVHVIDLRPYWNLAGTPMPMPDMESIEAEFRKELEGPWCEPLRNAMVRFRSELLEGEPAPSLLHAAEEQRADLIVVGSRGRGGFRELLLGSVAHYLTHHARQPVVVIPSVAAHAPEQKATVVSLAGRGR